MLKRLILALFLGLTPVLAPLFVHAEEVVAVASQTPPVNINTADAETLARQLAGVGQFLARAIVQYRDDFGPFFAVEDLQEVKGVGPSIVDKNRDRIILE